MDQLQRDELIVLAFDGATEVEAGVSAGRGTSGVAGGAAGPALGRRLCAPKPPISPYLFPAQGPCPFWTQAGSVSLLDTGGVAPGYANSNNSLCLLVALTR